MYFRLILLKLPNIEVVTGFALYTLRKAVNQEVLN